MKKIILILIGLTLVSCDFVKKQNKSKFDNISEKDTTCLNDITDAKFDIQKGKLVYCYNLGSITHHSLRSEEELTSILKQINIEFRNVASSDIDYENQTHCYCEFMKEKITEKYGEKIIDSILVLSEKLYLKIVSMILYIMQIAINVQIIRMIIVNIKGNLVKYYKMN